MSEDTMTTNTDAVPIAMVLFCPACGVQHIDGPEIHAEADASIGLQIKDVVTWANPPHRSHLCHACGTIWRPADIATTGVRYIQTTGERDNWPRIKRAAPAAEVQADHIADERKMVTDAARDVLAERQRQVTVEEFMPIDDDRYQDGSLAGAAICYALTVFGARDLPNYYWPRTWSASWWKPTTIRRNLVKAGALILAEIERIDRAASSTGNHEVGS
jgi:hypothetical protein